MCNEGLTLEKFSRDSLGYENFLLSNGSTKVFPIHYVYWIFLWGTFYKVILHRNFNRILKEMKCTFD